MCRKAAIKAAFRDICRGLSGDLTWEFRVDATFYPWVNPGIITSLLDDSDSFIRARAALWAPNFPSLFCQGPRYRENYACLFDIQVLLKHKDWRMKFIGALRADKDFPALFPEFLNAGNEDDMDEEDEDANLLRIAEEDLLRDEHIAVALNLNPLTPPEMARCALEYLDDLYHEDGFDDVLLDDEEFILPQVPLVHISSPIVPRPEFQPHVPLSPRLARIIKRGNTREFRLRLRHFTQYCAPSGLE